MTAPTVSARLRTVLLPDLLLAVVVAVLVLVGFGISLDELQFGPIGRHPHPPAPIPRELLEVGVGALPLAFRRVAPLPVYLLVAGASLVSQLLNRRPEPLPLAVLVALYTVVVLRRPLVSALAAAGYVAVLVADTLTGSAGVTDEASYADLLAVVGTVTLGYGVALGRARATLAERRAAELSRAADARTREAVEQEKARIAREMHDILAHNLSVIVAQAAVARQLSADRPQAAAEALGAIESVGRDALDGSRQLVGRLKVDGTRAGPLQPRLDRLDPLLEQVRRAGLPVELAVRGRPRPLPAAVEESGFRIVQEALTNSLRHAGRTRARVTLTYGDDALEIDVLDEGEPQAGRSVGIALDGRSREPSAGYGLAGMQQRVARLGGELAAGPREPRGFRVRARLPHAGSPG